MHLRHARWWFVIACVYWLFNACSGFGAYWCVWLMCLFGFWFGVCLLSVALCGLCFCCVFSYCVVLLDCVVLVVVLYLWRL